MIENRLKLMKNGSVSSPVIFSFAKRDVMVRMMDGFTWLKISSIVVHICHKWLVPACRLVFQFFLIFVP